MNQEFCTIVGMVAAYLDKHPDGADRLRAFMEDGKDGLWSTEELCTYTGWGRTYVSSLCNTGRLPYIPGRPNRFIPKAVKAALEGMQTGGTYGRRKVKLKPRRVTG